MGELVRLFLRLGTTAFGGPAAHIAMMHDEVVRRRGWLADQEFLDLVGATNLIPGPNSTELAIHLGYRRARWWGLVAAGVAFIVPAVVIVTVLAWAYVRYGRTPTAEGLLYAIGPVIIAIIAVAVVRLAATAVKGPLLAAVAVAALVAYVAGINELLILAASGVVVLGARHRPRRPPSTTMAWVPFLAVSHQTASDDVSLLRLFAVLLKIGAVLYGSGYVLLAFLRADLVERLGWITERQLLDAITVGQLTPGPVFTTATFVGYLVAGLPGALVATLAIFLPSFLFVALLTRVMDRLRRSPVTGAVLDGVNVASLALMAGVGVQLGRQAIVDPLTAGMAVAAGGVLWRTTINSGWLIGAAIVVGLVRSLIV